MKVGIVRCYTPQYVDVHLKTWPSVVEYGKKFGYHTIAICLPADSDTQYVSRYKMEVIMEFLSTYSHVLWIDADAYIQNPVPIENFLDFDHDLFISKDINGINAGVIAFGNGAIPLISEMLQMQMSAPWFEQGVLKRLIEETFPAKVKYLNQSAFQAYKYSLYGLSFPEGEATKDSFIIHLPGLTNEQRIENIPVKY